VGGALAFAPLLVVYTAQGEVATLLAGIVPWQTATEYAGRAEGTLLGNVLGGLGQIPKLYWLPVGFIVLGVIATVRESAADRTDWIPGLLWLGASFLGVSIGQRYYLHYAVQYAPALALVAGHPAWMRPIATLTRRLDATALGRWLAFAAATLLVGVTIEVGVGRGHRYEAMPRRLQDGRTAAQAAGTHIRERTDPDETIQVWGWTAWRVYYWADRRAATRVYKPMGTVTTFNTNTAFASSDTLRFRDGPAAAEMIEQFDRAPPTYFVYSPSMVQAFGAKTEPLDDFVALRDRIVRDYVPEAAFGDLRLFRRRR
jgi:hypothetical protein